MVALIVPDAEWACSWAQANGEKFDLAALQALPAYRSAIRAAIEKTGFDSFYSVEVISKKHRVLPLKEAARRSFETTMAQFAEKKGG